MAPRSSRPRHWLSPFVYLSNNWLSRIGVVIVTTAAVFWLLLLPTSLRGEVSNPYIGILAFLLLPACFLLGLGLIPLGIWLRTRRERHKGIYPADFPPLDFRNVELRRLLAFVALTTVANLIIGSQSIYGAVTYMDSVTFCGQTCHTVMEPEFAAYQNSPHSRVDCVACHIGPGAPWFVRSKLSGVGQVFAVTFNTYPRPIPTPVRNLRPARETCEACHWPQKFGEDRVQVLPKYADDEANTVSYTVLLMLIGGGRTSRGIHGAHLGPGITVEYSPSDESRQTMPRVEYRNSSTGRTAVYLAADAKPDAAGKLPRRLMDCMDCHNRPTHTFELPERAVDHAIATGLISRSLPFIKKTGVELLRKEYRTQAEAAEAIPAGLERFYQQSRPDLFVQRRFEITQSARAILAIYQRNVFPQMKVNWGAYPNNLGHTDFSGCFRCHDDAHAASDGKKITQDCNTCHRLLAMEEAAPKILADLGLEQ